MNGRGYSQAEAALYQQGAFANRIDPWAETGRYFQSLHSEIIGRLLQQLRDPLLAMGYVAGRETSLQVTAGREPDIYVQTSRAPVVAKWDYDLVAAELLAAPALSVGDDAELEALHIRDGRSGDLVTIVEIVSPSNKTDDLEIAQYQARRRSLFLTVGVNVVEVDLTRSVKRLLINSETRRAPYHVAIFLPADPARVIKIGWGERLPRIALPLRAEAVPCELHEAYANAYATLMTAWHIEHDGRYTAEQLPFSSTIDEAELPRLLSALQTWRAALAAATSR
jgi:Protein of unknown function (DUF4058)